MAEIIDGKKIAANVKAEVRAEVEKLRAQGADPGLAVVLVGNNPASRVYVSNKEKDCAECGFKSYEYALPEETTEAQLLELVAQLNADEKVNGILVQLPLPKQICEQTILHAISPAKDVDAFHPENVGRIMIGDYSFLPCTPAGVIEMLDAMKIDISGKHCVVIGRSNIVGKPMGMLLLHRSGTVTICHSRTQNLPEIVNTAYSIPRPFDLPHIVFGDGNYENDETITKTAYEISISQISHLKNENSVVFEQYYK